MNFPVLRSFKEGGIMADEVREKVRQSLLKDFSKYSTRTQPTEDDRIYKLGIPADEMTSAVQLTISALLEQIDDLKLQQQYSEAKINELESLVDVDCLTPLPNRRAFMRRLEWAVSMRTRHGHKVSVVFFDLNGFKYINDNYGHEAGDMAIQHVADILKSMSRETDFIARIGGDEFAMIMYHADEASAAKRAAEIAQTLQSTPFAYESNLLHVGSAVGAYELKDGDSAEYALRQADMAMFENKRVVKNGQKFDA